MSNSGAYDAGLPCKNPNCKSHGTSHPNCKCYPGLAKGGDVSNFCSKDQPHEKDCEYFSDGGQAGDVPPLPSGFKLDEPDSPPLPPGAKLDPEPDDGMPALPAGAQLDSEKYSTPMQQVATGLEGAAQGFAGPLVPAIEIGLSKLGVPGVSSEEQAAREKENPNIHGLSEAGGLAADFIPGLGGLGLVAKLGNAAKAIKIGQEAGIASKIGAGVLNNAIKGGIFQTSDEATKALLGQGDPNEAVSGWLADAGKNILTSAAGAGAVGGIGGLGSGILDKLAQSKLGEKLTENKIGTAVHSFLAGIGETAKGVDPENSYAKYLDEKHYNLGVKFWNNNVTSKVIGTGAATAAVSDILHGYNEDDLSGGFKKVAKDLGVGIGATLGAKVLSKKAGATLLWMISNGETNPRSLLDGLNYANQVNNGAQKIGRGIENLFTIGGQKLYNEEDLAKKRDKLNDFIMNGGIDQNVQQSIYDANGAPSQESQGFARGGEVEKSNLAPGPTAPLLKNNDPISTHYPEQSFLLGAAKGRISNYLNSIRPQDNQPKLAFDDAPDNRKQMKSYNRALDIANQPLSILDKIKQGTIESEHVQHFKNMFPEVDDVLQKKLAQKISEAQMDGKKPSYAVRQGLSLFMGTPLSGELSPQHMQAAQAVFQPKQAPQGQSSQGMPAKKTSAIAKMGSSYLTSNQASAERQQKQS